MKKSKFDLWIGGINLFNCILFIISWFAIFGADFTTRMAMFFYLFAWTGAIINTIAVVQSHNFQISMVGPILGVIGNALYGFTAALALPAVIVNIVSAFFIFMQHDNTKKRIKLSLLAGIIFSLNMKLQLAIVPASLQLVPHFSYQYQHKSQLRSIRNQSLMQYLLQYHIVLYLLDLDRA